MRSSHGTSYYHIQVVLSHRFLQANISLPIVASAKSARTQYDKGPGLTHTVLAGAHNKHIKKPQRLCKISAIWHLSRRGPRDVSVDDQTVLL